ncbi:smile protein, putative [Pediculus humanus corporis]|uniref:dolichyl-phosphate-mannose--protein mannosyltransferase n=1 Tax=Pediculus humanus subsp. corporis TaxID=121224 RepID=E0VKZ8_PEDHC|nr:smile protein, putative [Pediculus humanus corporis]EEB14054.1 smile protein, putative [Pediculus humanus corporis]
MACVEKKKATHAIVGLESAWFHICNIILHAVASILFTRVCFTVVGLEPEFATTAGALFAAHPIHTEAVTGIVGRADVLACVFFLLSFLSYHEESNKSYVWSSIALAAFSMLAKETGIMALLLNICYDFYKSWHSIKRRAAKVFVSLSLLLVFRLAVLQSSLPKFSNQDNPAAFHPYRHVRFMTFCYLTALNCWLLLFPATLSHDWQMGSIPLITNYSDSRNTATCLFFCCLAILIYKGIVDFEHQKHPSLVLGLSLLVFPFLPATNLAVTVGFVVAERLLYIPSLGWTLLVVYGLQLLRIKQKFFSPVPIVILVIFVFCGRSILRNRDWNSRESLIRSGLKTLPQNAKMHYNFANFLRDSGNVEMAASHYKEALRLWPSYASAHNNLGTLMSRPKDAEQHFLAAIRYSPNHVNAYYNLGQVYRKVNKTAEGLRMLERCITIDNTYTPAYLLMAKLHTIAGNKKKVEQLLRHVIKMHPKNPDHLAEYAGWLYDQGLKLKSMEYYKRALSHVAPHKSSLLGMAKILRAQGQLPRVHQITIRSHIMARVESGNQIFTGDLYFRSWQLQRQFQQLSNSRNTQQIESHFASICLPENTTDFSFFFHDFFLFCSMLSWKYGR